MTVQAILTQVQRSGIVLTVSGDKLRLRAPAGALTPELKSALAANKPDVIAVVWRLDGMQGNAGRVPIPCAVLSATGGPGRCFSCGDPLDHPEAYGRCVPCGLAAELFYAAITAAGEAVAG